MSHEDRYTQETLNNRITKEHQDPKKETGVHERRVLTCLVKSRFYTDIYIKILVSSQKSVLCSHLHKNSSLEKTRRGSSSHETKGLRSTELSEHKGVESL